MKYKNIIWDIDGTLLDTHDGVSAALRFTLKQYKISATKQNILDMVHTPRIGDAFMNIAGMDECEAKKATDMFRKQYVEADLLKAVPYQGILEVLKICQQSGIKQSVATNKRQDCAVKICAHFGIDAYCRPICGGDRYNTLSKADLIKKCLNHLDVGDLSTAVMIGDTDSDRKAAETVGIDFIGVNYGFGFKGIHDYADTADDIMHLLEIVYD